MSALLEARDLGRFYGDVVGVCDLTLTLEPGVVGLLGPNGAGKSTFLKLLVGELRPSRGALRVLGHEPFANRELYRELGFCPQQDALYGELTGLEFVEFLLRIGGFAARAAREHALRALELVHMTGAMHRRTREYSKGMRQRTKIAQAIAHEPRFLVLDEAMTGLDPRARHELNELLASLARAGTSILVSSHVLHEIEALTENIVLLHRGRLLARGAVSEIRELLDRHPRKVELRAREPRRLARALLALECVASVRLAGEDLVQVETTAIDRFLDELARVAAAERAGIASLEAVDAGLEAVFDYLVGSTA